MKRLRRLRHSPTASRVDRLKIFDRIALNIARFNNENPVRDCKILLFLEPAKGDACLNC